MIVALYGKRVHAWLMFLSKFQAGILYFLMTAIPVIAVYLIAGVLFYHNYWGAFKDAGFLLVVLSMDAIYGAIFFKEKAFKKTKKEQELSTGESPPGNISNSEFIVHWGKKRKAGILRYVIFNGLFAAFALIFPVSFLLYPYAQSTVNPFTDLSDMLAFILKCFCIGFFAGAAYYVLSWYLNERHFKRLI